jgi:hypothetical protein
MVGVIVAVLSGLFLVHFVWFVAGFAGLIFWVWLVGRICTRAGFSGWWGFAGLVPPLFVILVWMLAFAEWPRTAPVEILPPRHGYNNRPGYDRRGPGYR